MKNCLRQSSLLTLVLFFFSQCESKGQSMTLSCDSLHKPLFPHVTYRASIDVINKHLSGLLVFKTMEDSSIRAVFLNEAGVTFFTIAYTTNDYRFLSVIASLDKRAVRRTLAKDLGMILMRGVFDWKRDIKKDHNAFVVQLKRKGRVHYNAEGNCVQYPLIRNFGRRKSVVEISQTFEGNNPIPECIFVRHNTVHFTISLKQMHATE